MNGPPPSIDTTPFWWRDNPPRAINHGLPVQVDVVVIGGGYTGLNAALTLRAGGATVVVLEAQDFGYGASTRNAGHVSSGINLGKGASSALRSPMEQNLSAEMLRAVRQEASQSFDYLESRVAGLPDKALYKRTGRFVAAVTPAHYTGFAAKVGDQGGMLVARVDQRSEIGTDIYHGGMVVPRSGQLHPARYLHELVNLAQDTGVILCSGVRAQSITNGTVPYHVLTNDGMITCDNVLVATNGYTDQLLPWLRRRVIPVASYIAVTEPLPNGLMAQLIPQGRTVADSRRLLNYFRPTPCGTRLLFGGRATLRPRDPACVAQELQQRMRGIFPELAGTAIAHAWTGTIAFTFDFMPHLGNQEGISYALGCNGSGVAMLSYLGHRGAQHILGQGQSAFWNLPFPTLPFYRNTPWFLPLMSGYQRARDWLDMRASR